MHRIKEHVFSFYDNPLYNVYASLVTLSSSLPWCCVEQPTPLFKNSISFTASRDSLALTATTILKPLTYQSPRTKDCNLQVPLSHQIKNFMPNLQESDSKSALQLYSSISRSLPQELTAYQSHIYTFLNLPLTALNTWRCRLLGFSVPASS